MTDCLFCSIAAGGIPSSTVYEDETSYAFLDISPFHRGHTVIVPKRHVTDGTSAPQAWSDIATAIVAVSSLAKEKLGALGVNILSNAGEIAGQSVFHFHVHVIPRYADNPGMGGLMRRDEHAGDDLPGVLAQLQA